MVRGYCEGCEGCEGCDGGDGYDGCDGGGAGIGGDGERVDGERVGFDGVGHGVGAGRRMTMLTMLTIPMMPILIGVAGLMTEAVVGVGGVVVVGVVVGVEVILRMVCSLIRGCLRLRKTRSSRVCSGSSFGAGRTSRASLDTAVPRGCRGRRGPYTPSSPVRR